MTSIQRIGLNGTAVVQVPTSTLNPAAGQDAWKAAAKAAAVDFIVGYAANWAEAKATRATMDAEGKFFSVTLHRTVKS